MTDLGVGLDTLVLVRLLTGQPEELTTAALEFLDEIERKGAPVFVSNPVVSEACFACHHHYGIPKLQVLDGLHEVLSQPTFQAHAELLDLLATPGLDTAKPGFLDRQIHAEYVEAGVPLVSFEKTASKLTNTLILREKDEQ